ncbi:MAG: DUF4349 domain-containing protein [Armatimonadota bacterium]|nr:DUF4349 domain-containing protein [Armatimonadota bacterium]MDW8025036.1 DUF4349 domain-containing protein [Armatimonadota bacterium]
MPTKKRWLKLTLAAVGVFLMLMIFLSGVIFLSQLLTVRYGLSPTPPSKADSDESYHMRLRAGGKDYYAEVGTELDASVRKPSKTTHGMSQLMLVAVQPKLIWTASISLQVRDVPKMVNEIRQIAISLKGYVSSVSQYQEGDHWGANIVMRVPSERYNEALQRLHKVGEVVSFTEEVEDVTEEFIDIEARLRNLKRSEEHLLELLKRSGKVSELLSVERELANRRSEIERLEGRLRYLTQRVAFSTINVTLTEFRPRPLPAATFSIVKVAADAFRSVVTVARTLLIGAIWMFMFGVFFGVPMFIIVWLIYKRVRFARPTISGS